MPELQHNWSLRLDRIPVAAITSVRGQWRSRLDHIEVELHLLGRLAFAYETKTEDIASDWLTDSHPPIRRVVRRVSNTFWFFREVLRYAEDCVIVSPESVRSRFKQKLRSLYEQYEL